MPLNEEQYNKLVEAGYSTSQIMQFEAMEDSGGGMESKITGSPMGTPGLGIAGVTIDGKGRVSTRLAPKGADPIIQRKILEEKAKGGKGLALVDEIERNWLRTNPPNVGMLGINGAGILPQPLHGVSSKIGSIFQLTQDARNDRNYVRFVKQFQSRLAKSAVGEDVGNLAAQEQQIVREGMPGLTDYKETGEDMIAITKRALRAMREARDKGYSDVFGYMQEKGKPLDEKTAQMYFKKAKGNPDRATLFAIADGFNVNE